jgi:hypothetical protein
MAPAFGRITHHGAATDVFYRMTGASFIERITRTTEGLVSYIVLHYTNGQQFRVRVEEIK